MDAGIGIESSYVSFRDWTGDRDVLTLGTNAGSATLPFQSWRRFKEAFAPELIERAVSETPGHIQRISDPFGGSGTTALAAQFLGVEPCVIEVNPYLADLIEAKIAPLDVDDAAAAFGRVVERATTLEQDFGDLFPGAPKTFVEPGVGGRFIFSAGVALRLAFSLGRRPLSNIVKNTDSACKVQRE